MLAEPLQLGSLPINDEQVCRIDVVDDFLGVRRQEHLYAEILRSPSQDVDDQSLETAMEMGVGFIDEQNPRTLVDKESYELQDLENPAPR